MTVRSIRQAQGKLKKQIQELPQKPGVYFLKNGKEEVLYIGKAINIKKRVQSHFTNGHSFGKFYPQVRSVDFITVRSEKDALVLENQLIKKFQPKYNIDWKDDKNYSYVAFTREPLPRLFITHQPKSVDAYAIGPFIAGFELKKFLFDVRKLFPYKSCKNKPEKPCLYYDLGLCWAHGPEAKRYPLMLKGLQTLLHLYAGDWGRHPYKSVSSPRLAAPSLEGYDISNTQGSLSVGSMVAFKGTRPDKSMYRKFKIRTVAGSDDPLSMLEIITRRLNHPEWPYPDLIVLDGGRSQLSKLKNLPIPTVALAKLTTRTDRHGLYTDGKTKKRSKTGAIVYSPYGKTGIPLSAFPGEIAQTLLALRDESHRFAITYHRKRRAKDLLS